MKAIKRTIASLLATLMFVSCFSFNFAFGADNYTEEEAIAVSKVNAASIMTGTENGFEPSKTLTRAEAAAIVVRMKGIPDSQVESAKGDTLFTDVPASSWATGYINAASSMGIISGVGGGLFQPDREVTVIEFVAMATRALGAGKLVDSIGTWPTNYVNFAGEENLLDGVLKVYTAPATRMDVAFMVVNTIEANTWEKKQVTNTNEVTYVETSNTILTDVLEISVAENVTVSNISTKDRTATYSGDAAGWSTYDVVEGVELATLKPGMEVDVWAKVDDREVIRIAPAEKSKQVQVSFNGIEKIDTDENKITLLVNGSEKKYSYDDADMFVASYNSVAEAVAAVEGSAQFTVDSSCSSTGADKDIVKSEDIFGTATLEGSKITALYLEAYENKVVVEEIKNDTIYFESTSDVKKSLTTVGSSIDLEDDDLEFFVTKNGKEIKVTDIEEEDALYFYVDGDRYVIVVNNYAVEGEIDSLSATDYVKVDGKKYELTNGVKLAGGVTDLSAGDDVKLYLNGKNKVTMYEINDGNVDSTVAIVKSLRQITDKYGDSQLEIVLVQLDGTELETKVVDLEETLKKLVANEVDIDGDDDNDTSDEAELLDLLYVDAETISPIVGSMIRYTLKAGEVVIREFNNAGTIVTSYDETKMAKFTTQAYNENSAKLGSYRLTEDTVIYLVKAETGNDAKYSVKLEEIAFEDLGTSSGLTGLVYNVDENTNEVSAVVFTTAPNRATNNNYAVVADKGTGSDDDYPNEYDLLFADGSVVEVKAESALEFAIGDVLEVKVNGEVLEDAELVVADTTANFGGEDDDMYYSVSGYVYAFNDGSVRILTANDTDDVYDLAETVLYVLVDEDEAADLTYDEIQKGKPAAGALRNIKTVSTSVTTMAEAATTGVEVRCIFAKNTDTTEDEIVAIFYRD